MRGLEVRIARRYHPKAGELLEQLQEAFGLDEVTLVLRERVRQSPEAIQGVGFSYDRATDADQTRLDEILTAVLGL